MNGNRIFAIAVIAVATAVPGFLAGVWLHEESTIEYKRGSSTVEFVTTQKAKAPEAPRPRRVVLRLPWPTYGLRVQRTHTSEDFKLRPPFRLRWAFKAGHVLEFPPSIGYGRLYVRAAARTLLCVPPPNGQDRLAAAVQPLLRSLADGRLPRRLPLVDAAAALQPVPAEPARTGGSDGGPHREDRLAVPGGRVRVLAAGGRQDALRRLVGPQAPRGQHLHRQGPLDLHRRRRGEQLSRVREREGLLRNRRRQSLRAGRSNRTAALALAGACAIRAARVLLRHADDRLRPHLRREHRRHALCLRRLERPAAVGPAGRQLHLHGGCGLAAAGVHRYVRRSVHGLQRGDRGPAVALPGLVRDPRCAERHRRSRLLRRLPALWPKRFPVVQERRPRHLRPERTHREARLALARRCLQSRHRRQPAPLHRWPLPRVQLCTEESSRSA